VSPRTLRRDVERLRELGYPVEASRGVAGGYQLQAGAALPPLLLDDEEAVAIAVGLRNAAGSAVAGIGEASVRALAKIVQVMPPRLRRRVDALQTYTVPAALGAGTTVDANTLTVIAQACRDDERLRFGYRTRAGERASRLVEPHRLVSLGSRWYLVAWDTERHDWRTFRVDRLTDPTVTGMRFRPRELPASDAAEFVRDQLASIPTRYQVIVDVRAAKATVQRAVWDWGTVEPLNEQVSRLTMNVDSFEWPAFVLGTVGAEFTIVQPDEFGTYLRELGERLLRSA